MTKPPAVVTLHLWGIPWSVVPQALLRVVTQPPRIRHYPGVTFAKLLGTARSDTFAPKDTDLQHWGLLVCWDSRQSAAAFERSRHVYAWDQQSDERLRLGLRPVASRGSWSGRTPFGEPSTEMDASAVAITRARLRFSRMRMFREAVPPVVDALRQASGLAMAVGVGELPVGLQGTLSAWHRAEDLKSFAYAGAHRDVIARTPQVGWYAEELFARFAVLECEGSYLGRELQLVTSC